ncbi:MAG: hypothetical protein LBQ77_02060 [Treponema sp.]|jgi:hypothetical protein|nr:hypothetical protein [Treponema sp.]
MAQKVGLYSILKFYAQKSGSSYINTQQFLDFLTKYAVKHAPNHPEWEEWTKGVKAKFTSELSKLLEQNKCQNLSGDKKGMISLPYYYIDMIQDAYQKWSTKTEELFPSEGSLSLKVPGTELVIIQVEQEFIDYLRDPPEEDDMAVYRLQFTEARYGSILATADLLPNRLLEVAVLKISLYLNNQSDKDYIEHKLRIQFQGKEGYLKEIINRIVKEPLQSINTIKEGGDSSNIFWLHFCSLIRIDMKKKADLLTRELAVVQAVHLVEQYYAFYKAKAVKNREREFALKALDSNFETQPFIFTMGDILNFTNNQDIPLLGQYSEDDLQQYLNKKTSESTGESVSEILLLRGMGGEQWFVKKTKLLNVCARLLTEVRPQIKKNLLKRWLKLLKDFQREPAMDNDTDFEKLLSRSLKEVSPQLAAILGDSRLLLVYMETESSQEKIPETARFFINGKLIPMTSLLLVKRKDVLAEINIDLPFYYSVPLLFRIAAYFHGLKRKKVKPPVKQRKTERVGKQSEDLKTVLKAAEEKLVPEGSSIEATLESLKKRWGKLLDPTSQKNLIEDVNSLVRDRLRKLTRVRNIKITPEMLDQMAEEIAGNEVLARLHETEALQQYIKLYMIDQLLPVALRRDYRR